VDNATGGADLVTYDYAGTQQATIAGAAPHTNVAFRVLSNGDIATASATAAEVSVRRLSGGSTTFTHNIAIQYSAAPTLAITETTANRVFLVYGATAPISGGEAGYDAAIINATGGVDWTLSRPRFAVNGGAEVYALASNATDVAVAGGFGCLSPDAGAATTGDVTFGAGFVQTFRP
jgi:hypothetical protein